MRRHYTVQDIMQILSINKTKAYEIITTLNKELEQTGYHIIQGRVSAVYFEKCFDYQEEKHASL